LVQKSQSDIFIPMLTTILEEVDVCIALVSVSSPAECLDRATTHTITS